MCKGGFHFIKLTYFMKHTATKKDSKKKADSAQASQELNKKYLQVRINNDRRLHILSIALDCSAGKYWSE